VKYKRRYSLSCKLCTRRVLSNSAEYHQVIASKLSLTTFETDISSFGSVSHPCEHDGPWGAKHGFTTGCSCPNQSAAAAAVLLKKQLHRAMRLRRNERLAIERLQQTDSTAVSSCESVHRRHVRHFGRPDLQSKH
jgi:hypothetical protein